MILAGDIGGTKTVLGLFDPAGSGVHSVREQTFSSHAYGSLSDVIDAFLPTGARPSLTGACFGVAGQICDGRTVVTNLPWVVEASDLGRSLNAPVVLINDLVAAAYGLLVLPPESFVTLQAGRAVRGGNVAVIAPGTGLGEAMLIFDGTRYRAVSSEGGHADFAARSELEVELFQHLHRRFGHVSYERVLAGDGFSNIFSFLTSTGQLHVPEWLESELAAGDRNARITACGLEDRADVCVKTLEMFVTILAAEAGNMALRGDACGGVIIGGGIAPKILPALQKPAFLSAFADKGRFAAWLKDVPVRVARDSRAPLIGAAHQMFQQPGGSS